MKARSLFSIISFSILFSLSGCIASGSVSNVEEKIIGTWEFSEVGFRPKGNTFYSDYSDGYQGSSITFKQGGILEAYDKDLDITASGNWVIDFYYDYDSDNNEKRTIYYMVGTLDIPQLEIHEDLLWDELKVSNKTLNCIEKDKDNGRYKYKLRR